MGEPDDHYFLSKARFDDEFRELYQRADLGVHQLLQFPVLLPFNLPFPDVVSTTYVVEDGACTLAFRTVSSEKAFSGGIVGPEPVKLPVHRTGVEMIYATGREEPLKLDEDGLTDVFETLVFHLNLLISAYALLYEDTQAHPVSREMFEPASIARWVPVHAWDDARQIVFLQHGNVATRAPELEKAEIEQVLWYSHVVRAGLNPFMLSKETHLSARRALRTGRYQEAVVFAQAAVETFLAAWLVRLLALKEGHSIADAEAVVETMPFISRVKREYHTRIGGQWDIAAQGTAVGSWHRDTYEMRNRVVHGGYAPSFAEAAGAMAASGTLIAYAISLLKARKREFGPLLEFLTAPPELPKNGA